MNNILGVSIRESEYSLANNKKGTMAVFIYYGDKDSKVILDQAVSQYVQNKPYHELIDINPENQGMRVILSNINDMEERRLPR